MAGRITTKPSVEIKNGTYEIFSGNYSQRITQNNPGSWAQSGTIVASIPMTGALLDLMSPGLVQVTNLSPVDAGYKNIFVAIGTDTSIFMLLAPGEQYVFRAWHTTPLYRIGPDGAGTDPLYQFEMFED